MTFSKGQLEALWATVNPGNGDPHLMAAIALAESSGNSSSTNSIDACGLWQIHPYEAGCLDPVTNARQAGEKLRSQGLGAWEAYTNGDYKQFYTGGVQSTGERENTLNWGPLEPFGFPGEEEANKIFEKPLESLVHPLEDPLGLGSLGKIPGDFDKIYKLLFTPEGWVRIGKVLVGLFLLLTGVLGMANVSTAPVVVTGLRGATAAAA